MSLLDGPWNDDYPLPEEPPFDPRMEPTTPDNIVDPEAAAALRVPEPGKRRFRLLSRKQLADLPPPTWLIEGVLAGESLVMLFGAPSAAKSFQALAWACCIASGRNWHHFVVKGAAPVVYVAGEGTSGLDQRIAAWEQRNPGADTSQLLTLPETVRLLEDYDVNEFIALLREMETPPALIVIDTVARAAVGGDENSASSMGLLVHAADRIKQATGATVLLVHHSTADGNKERGSTALRGAMDQVLKFQHNEVDGTRVLFSSKMKDAPDFTPIRQVLVPEGQSAVLVPATNPGTGLLPSNTLGGSGGPQRGFGGGTPQWGPSNGRSPF